MENFEADLDLDLGLGFDSDFQSFLHRNSNETASTSTQQTLNRPAASSSKSSKGFGGIGCSECFNYQEEIERMKEQHKLNFLFLKKKIINTDMLIRRFKAKQDEAELQANNVLALKKQLENANRESSILSEQLKTAMEDMKPLKEDKLHLESELRERNGQIVGLKDRLHAEEAWRNQTMSVNQRITEIEDEKLELDKKMKSLESRNRILSRNLKNMESDKRSLSSQNNVSTKRLNKLALLLNSAQKKVDSMWKQLSTAGLTERSKKPSVIPNAVKFLITEALKAHKEPKDKKNDKKAVKSAGEDLEDGMDDDDSDNSADKDAEVENGFEDETEDSDFDNVSTLDLSFETPAIVHKNADLSEAISVLSSPAGVKCVKEQGKANGVSKQNSEQRVQSWVNAKHTTNNVNKKGSPLKSKPNSSSFFKRRGSVPKIADKSDRVEKSPKGKDVTAVSGSSNCPQKVDKTSEADCSIAVADLSCSSSSEDERDNKQEPSRAKPKKNILTKQRSSSVGLDNGKKVALSAGGVIGKRESGKAEDDDVSEESSLSSLSSASESSGDEDQDEGFDVMAAQRTPQTKVKKTEKSTVASKIVDSNPCPTVRCKNNDKASSDGENHETNTGILQGRLNDTFSTDCETKEENRPKAAGKASEEASGQEVNGVACFEDAEDTSLEDGRENASFLDVNQSSGLQEAIGDTHGNLSLDEIFSDMSVLSPLSPLSPAPCQHTRLHDEKDDMEEESEMPLESDWLLSKRNIDYEPTEDSESSIPIPETGGEGATVVEQYLSNVNSSLNNTSENPEHSIEAMQSNPSVLSDKISFQPAEDSKISESSLQKSERNSEEECVEEEQGVCNVEESSPGTAVEQHHKPSIQAMQSEPLLLTGKIDFQHAKESKFSESCTQRSDRDCGGVPGAEEPASILNSTPKSSSVCAAESPAQIMQEEVVQVFIVNSSTSDSAIHSKPSAQDAQEDSVYESSVNSPTSNDSHIRSGPCIQTVQEESKNVFNFNLSTSNVAPHSELLAPAAQKESVQASNVHSSKPSTGSRQEESVQTSNVHSSKPSTGSRQEESVQASNVHSSKPSTGSRQEESVQTSNVHSSKPSTGSRQEESVRVSNVHSSKPSTGSRQEESVQASNVHSSKPSTGSRQEESVRVSNVHSSKPSTGSRQEESAQLSQSKESREMLSPPENRNDQSSKMSTDACLINSGIDSPPKSPTLTSVAAADADGSSNETCANMSEESQVFKQTGARSNAGSCDTSGNKAALSIEANSNVPPDDKMCLEERPCIGSKLASPARKGRRFSSAGETGKLKEDNERALGIRRTRRSARLSESSETLDTVEDQAGPVAVSAQSDRKNKTTLSCTQPSRSFRAQNTGPTDNITRSDSVDSKSTSNNSAICDSLDKEGSCVTSIKDGIGCSPLHTTKSDVIKAETPSLPENHCEHATENSNKISSHLNSEPWSGLKGAKRRCSMEKGNTRSNELQTGFERSISISTNDEVGKAKNICDEDKVQKSKLRSSSVLTRKTQMEIAAQQLAKMLAAAKSAQKKRTDLGARVRAEKATPEAPPPTSCENVQNGRTPRGRGRPRKAAKSVADSDLNGAETKPGQQKRGLRRNKKCVLQGRREASQRVMQGMGQVDESLELSSLSSDSEVDNDQSPNARKKSVTEPKPLCGRNSQKSSDLESENPENIKYEHQSSEWNSLPASDSVQNICRAESKDALEKSFCDKQQGVEVKSSLLNSQTFEQHQNLQSATHDSVSPRRRNISTLSFRGNKFRQVKSTSIILDDGHVAETINTGRVKSKEFISSSSDDDDGGGCEKDRGLKKSKEEIDKNQEGIKDNEFEFTNKSNHQKEGVQKRSHAILSRSVNKNEENQCIEKKVFHPKFSATNFSPFKPVKSSQNRKEPDSAASCTVSQQLPNRSEKTDTNLPQCVTRNERVNSKDCALLEDAQSNLIAAPVNEEVSSTGVSKGESLTSKEDQSDGFEPFSSDLNGEYLKQTISGNSDQDSDENPALQIAEGEELRVCATSVSGTTEAQHPLQCSNSGGVHNSFSSRNNSKANLCSENNKHNFFLPIIENMSPKSEDSSSKTSSKDEACNSSKYPATVEDTVDDDGVDTDHKGLNAARGNSVNIAQEQLYANEGSRSRKRKSFPVESSDQYSELHVDTSYGNACQLLNLEEIFAFFQIPRCLSPLPDSPVPKKLRREGDESNRTSDFVSQSHALASDVAEAAFPPSIMAADQPCANTTSLATVAGAKLNTSGSSPGARKKRQAANLGKFLTPYAAILNDMNLFVKDPDGDAACIAATTVTRVAGWDVASVWAMLPQLVVECLSEQNQEDVLSVLNAACESAENIQESVFVTLAETQLTKFLCCLSAMSKDLDKTPIMCAIWREVFRQDANQSLHKMLSFCRLFTLLCMENGDLEQARVLLYSVAWCGYLPLGLCLVTVAALWPEVCGPTPCRKSWPVVRVIACMLTNNSEEDLATFQKVCRMMHQLCLWKLTDLEGDACYLLKSLDADLESLASASSSDVLKAEKMFPLLKAMELLLIYKGGEWVEEYFHRRMLVSVAMRWEHNQKEETRPHPAYVTGLFRVFQSVLNVLPLTPHMTKLVMSQVFARCLRKQNGELEVKHVLLESFLALSPHDPSRSVQLLEACPWANAAGKIPPPLLSELQEALARLTQLLSDEEKKKKKGQEAVKAFVNTKPQRGAANRGMGGKFTRSWRGKGRPTRGGKD